MISQVLIFNYLTIIAIALSNIENDEELEGVAGGVFYININNIYAMM